MDGVIVANKAEGWTSHDVVNKIRRLAKTRRVGHLGTLDPMATGVLPLVVGRATRLAQFYLQSDKVYQAVIRFGYATDTYDREGAPVSEPVEPKIDRDELERVLARFSGQIELTPPLISAKKVGGTPAYRLARKNIAVELPPVQVNVYSIRLVRLEGADAEIHVHCSAGTYLRSIAHELGQAFGCGAFLQALVRTAAADFTLEQARTIEQLEALAQQERLADALVPAVQLLPQFPAETVDPVTAGFIRQGRDFRVSPFRVRQGTRYVKAVTQQGELLAIGEAKLPNLYHPILVL